jgi:hypothetical protein
MGLPDPDPSLFCGSDPDLYKIRILPSISKKVLKRNSEKNLFFLLEFCHPQTTNAGSGSVVQCYGSPIIINTVCVLQHSSVVTDSLPEGEFVHGHSKLLPKNLAR